jgi:hypothetical protein
MWQTVSIGFDFLPGSIRARCGNDMFLVEEIDPIAGMFRIDMPPDFRQEVWIDYQRRPLRAGTPPPDQEIGIADACIYCGSQFDLRNEHIIPFGLGGTWVLQNGSCGDCATKTSRIELAVLRGALLPARTALHIRTRRPRERPDTLPVTEVNREGPIIRKLSISEHPTYLALPRFAAPAVLRKADQPNIVVENRIFQTLVGAKTLPQTSTRFGGAQVNVQVCLDIYAFARILGKIAHGFVSAADMGDVVTHLPAAILAQDESIGWWVGEAPDITVESQGLHGVKLSVSDGNVHVRIRLFAQLGAPEYLVVAGRLVEPSPDMRPFVTIEERSP